MCVFYVCVDSSRVLLDSRFVTVDSRRTPEQQAGTENPLVAMMSYCVDKMSLLLGALKVTVSNFKT